MIHKPRVAVGSEFVDEDGELWVLSEIQVWNDSVIEDWIRIQSDEVYTIGLKGVMEYERDASRREKLSIEALNPSSS